MEEDDEEYHEARRVAAERHRKQTVAVVAAAGSVIAALANWFTVLLAEASRNEKLSKVRKKRAPRRLFRYRIAYEDIMANLLGENALFSREFHQFFRLSIPRVKRLIEDFANSGDPFYRTFRVDQFGRMGASREVKILLPLRALAYGDAPHSFTSCFQVSESMARKCFRKFVSTIQTLYGDEYLRRPTATDLRAICSLHERVHGVKGMLGSLDCMLTKWKNCPMEWQGNFKGREKSMCTIVMEAVSDYYLWFWHVCYGNPGSMNDCNVLDMSPLLETLLDRSYVQVEQEAGVVPFRVWGEDRPFDKTFLLVDGAYPAYSRFVRTISPSITEEEKNFARWQEGARKDIERAFGVLQCRWKAMATPIQSMGLKMATNVTACCVILHNMCVSDRIMGDVYARYDPSKEVAGGGIEEVEDALNFPPGLQRNDAQLPPAQLPPAQQQPPIPRGDYEAMGVMRMREERELFDEEECGRLQQALVRDKGRSREEL